MKSLKLRRLGILLGVVVFVSAVIVVFSYGIVRIDWNSFMKIQPAFRPMDDPLPVPTEDGNLSMAPPSNASCSSVYPWSWSHVSRSFTFAGSSRRGLIPLGFDFRRAGVRPFTDGVPKRA